MDNIKIVTLIPIQYEKSARKTIAGNIRRIIEHADDREEILFPKRVGKNGVVTHLICEIKFPTHLFPSIIEILKEIHDSGELYWNYQATINTSPDELLCSCCIVKGTFLELIEKLGLEDMNAHNTE